MNTAILRFSLHGLFTAMLMASSAARAVDVKIVGDAEVQNALKATVLINTFTGPETGHATLGFFASAEGLVVTTAFSVAGAQKLTLFLADGSTITDARFLGTDENKRLAVLATNRKPPPAFLEVCSEPPAVGDACAMMGFQQADKSFQAASGQLLSRHPGLNASGGQFVDSWSVAARQDCAREGGVVVDHSGQAIGICWTARIRTAVARTAGNARTQWVMSAVTDKDIQVVLEKALQKGKPAPYPRLDEIERSPASSAQGDTAYREGLFSMQQGDFPAAIHKLTDTLSRHPKDPQTLTLLASCYSQSQQPEELAWCAKELTNAEGKFWNNRILIAGELANAGNLAAANDCLKAVLNEEPRLGYAWVMHSAILQGMGRKKEAVEAAKRSVELEPEFLWHWTTLSDALLDLGDIKAYQQARERADDLESLLFKLEHLPLWGLTGK